MRNQCDQAEEKRRMRTDKMILIPGGSAATPIPPTGRFRPSGRIETDAPRPGAGGMAAGGQAPHGRISAYPPPAWSGNSGRAAIRRPGGARNAGMAAISHRGRMKTGSDRNSAPRKGRIPALPQNFPQNVPQAEHPRGIGPARRLAETSMARKCGQGRSGPMTGPIPKTIRANIWPMPVRECRHGPCRSNRLPAIRRRETGESRRPFHWRGQPFQGLTGWTKHSNKQ